MTKTQKKFDAFQFEDSEDAKLNATKSKFRKTLVSRAEKREVIKKSHNRWWVIGNPKLNDYYPKYDVVYLPGQNIYTCSCAEHYYGEARARRICSHVLAVILWRRKNNDYNTIPSPQDPMFGYPPIPAKFDAFRPHQWEAIEKVVSAFESGKKYVLLDANTGSGKTLIAETVRRLLDLKMVYTCTTIMLQEQFLRDFPYAKLLKGRSNYPTLSYPDLFNDKFTNLSAADCTDGGKGSCPYCQINGSSELGNSSCPYKQAKIEAAKSNLLVTNSAYFLYESNFAGENSICDGSPFVVIDECDALESTLMSFCSFAMSARTLAKYEIGLPQKKTVEAAWTEWIDNAAIPKLTTHLSAVANDLKSSKPGSIEFVKLNREKNNLERTIKKLQEISPQIKEGSWVYTGYNDNKVEFKPVMIADYANDAIWSHGKKFLCMSGTIVSGSQFAYEHGIPEDEYQYIKVNYSFPVENRPVYVVPVANMTHKTQTEETPKLIDGIVKVLSRKKYQSERVLIHTVSAKLSNDIKTGLLKADLNRDILWYSDQDTKKQALNQYLKTPGAVLVSYSFDRGVDLPDDLCRCIIIAKIPFANLGDKQVSRRLYSKGGSLWYAINCIRTILQQCGRGNRHHNDWCDVWILDRQFIDNLWKNNKNLFPRDWTISVKMNMLL